MDEKYNIEDKHEIASIINHCLNDGYCDASMLARRITQAGYGICGKVEKCNTRKRLYPRICRNRFN